MAKNSERVMFADGTPVVLGGRTYHVRPLTWRRSKQWRAKFAEALHPIKSGMGIEMDSQSASSVVALVDFAIQFIGSTTDSLIELLVDFCPEMQADIDFLEENATDVEAARAFKEVLAVAFPFVSVLTTLMSGQGGSAPSESNGAAKITQ